MSSAPSTTSQAPLTEEAFAADRQSFFSSFTSVVTYATLAMVVLVLAMWAFLV